MKKLNLITARKEKNLTQEQLANEVGVTKSSVSNWENGYSTPYTELAIKVADVLGKEVSHLFGADVQVSHTKQLA